MKKTFSALAAIVLLVTGMVAYRTIQMRSKQMVAPAAADFNLDTAAISARLSSAIQLKTVSSQQGADSAGEFAKLHELLRQSFPGVHSKLVREVVGNYSLLYTWKGGNDQLKPILLMAHMDVVPVDRQTENQWLHPPFSGAVADGYIWGRGTMDDKGSVLSILEAVEHLLAQGFQPRRTIYLAFGDDEEIGGGNGAAKIAALLSSRKVDLEFIVDEGGNITDGIIAGVAAPVALIGVAEKGYLSLELSVESPGGHSSIPPPTTAIGILSRAIDALEQRPFPSRLTAPTRRMFDFIGPEMAWPKRMFLANLWLFDSLVRRQLEYSPVAAALVRTTQAATIFEAGMKENVLPTQARAVLNYRLLPGDTISSVTDHVRKIIANADVKITALPVQMEPSAVSDVDSNAFRLVHGTIRQIAPEAVIAPSLLVAATDSRHYAGLTRNIFRFLPITLRPEDAMRYHGINERISVQDYRRCVRFFVQLIKNSNQQPSAT